MPTIDSTNTMAIIKAAKFLSLSLLVAQSLAFVLPSLKHHPPASRRSMMTMMADNQAGWALLFDCDGKPSTHGTIISLSFAPPNVIIIILYVCH